VIKCPTPTKKGVVTKTRFTPQMSVEIVGLWFAQSALELAYSGRLSPRPPFKVLENKIIHWNTNKFAYLSHVQCTDVSELYDISISEGAEPLCTIKPLLEVAPTTLATALLLWPWTLILEFDLYRWRQSDPAYQMRVSKVISFKRYCPDTHMQTNTPDRVLNLDQVELYNWVLIT